MLTRMGHCPDDEPYAEQDKGNAEHLPHVHAVFRNHFIFRGNLHVFYIFDDEPREEDADKKHSGDEIRAFFGILFQYIHISRANSAK